MYWLEVVPPIFAWSALVGVVYRTWPRRRARVPQAQPERPPLASRPSSPSPAYANLHGRMDALQEHFLAQREDFLAHAEAHTRTLQEVLRAGNSGADAQVHREAIRRPISNSEPTKQGSELGPTVWDHLLEE